MAIVSGIFLVFHGLVHLLYFGQSARRFELTPGMTWPDGAWAFAKWLTPTAARVAGCALMLMAALGFAAAGAGVLLRQAWGGPAAAWVAVFSTVSYILLWDGRFKKLHNQGAIGILINLAILGAVFWR